MSKNSDYEDAKAYARWALTLESVAEQERRLTALAYLRSDEYLNHRKIRPGKHKPITKELEPLRFAYTQAEGELTLAVHESDRALALFVSNPNDQGIGTLHESAISTRKYRRDFDALQRLVARGVAGHC